MSKMRSSRPAAIATAAALVCLNVTASAATIHVPADHPTIQSAINAAGHGDEIIVAPGIYHETIRFFGKSIILHSAQGPAVTTINAAGLKRSAVAFTDGEDFTSIIDGFTITGGSGTPAAGQLRGGGFYIVDASPSIINCHIVGNTADYGAGAYVAADSQPWFVDSTFEINVAAAYGGAIYNGAIGHPSPSGVGVTVFNTTFLENSAPYGGAIRGTGQLALIACTLHDNTASQAVGGISISAGSLTLLDCNFDRNDGRAVAIGPEADATIVGSSFVDQPGGAISVWTTSSGRSLTIIDSAFQANVGLQGPAIAVSGEIELVVNDSVFQDNIATSFGGAIQTVCSSGIEATCPSVVITGSAFVGNWAGGSGGAISTACGSGAFGPECAFIDIEDCAFTANEAAMHGGAIHNRCIEWVNPQTGKAVLSCGEIHVRGSILDQNLAGAGGGAIANLDESSTNIEDSIFCSNIPEHVLGDWGDDGGNQFAPIADIDCDGVVGVKDLLALLAAWGKCDDEPGTCLGDLNGNGVVGVPDLLILLANWG